MHKPLPSRLSKRLEFTVGWRKSHLPGTFATNATTWDVRLAERLLSTPIFAKSCGSARRRRPSAVPPGFLPRKPSGVCKLPAHGMTGLSSFAVVDRAVARIQRSNNPACPASDPLQKVHFETSPDAGIHTRVEAALFSYIRRRGSVWRPPVIEFAANAQRGKIPQFGPARVGSQRLLEEHTSDYGTDRARVPETKTAGTGKKNRRS